MRAMMRFYKVEEIERNVLKTTEDYLKERGNHLGYLWNVEKGEEGRPLKVKLFGEYS